MNLHNIEFPIIFKICVLPGFDMEELRSVGYDSPRTYFLGQGSVVPHTIGWAGHGGNYGTVADVRERVLTNSWTVLNRIAIWTKSSNYIFVPEIYVKQRKLNRPNCLTLDVKEVEDLKNEDILQIFFFFKPTSNYTAEILLEDKYRSCDRTLKSNRLVFSGSSLKNNKLQRKEAKQYIVKVKQTIFNEKDESKNCVNYPTRKYKTFNECDEYFIQRVLDEFYPQNFTPVWSTEDMSLVTTLMEVTNTSYGDLADGTVVSDCPKPCKTTTFTSSHIATEPSSSDESSIEITFDESVPIKNTDFIRFTLVDILAAIGGTAGLWLGVGALQACQIIFDYMRRIYSRQIVF